MWIIFRKAFNLVGARGNCDAYLRLTDDIFNTILNYIPASSTGGDQTGESDIAKAKKILERVLERGDRLYKWLGWAKVKDCEQVKKMNDGWGSNITYFYHLSFLNVHVVCSNEN